MTSWRQRVSSLLDSESSPTPSPKGPQYKSGPYEYLSPEPSTPYTNNTGFWCVVVGGDVGTTFASFQVLNGGVSVDSLRVGVAGTANVTFTVTSGSAAGSAWFVGDAFNDPTFPTPPPFNALYKKLLVPPGAVVNHTVGSVRIQVILCDTLKDALDLVS